MGELSPPTLADSAASLRVFRTKKSPREYCRLRHNASWLIRHLKEERWGQLGDGSARKHNQPRVVRSTHLREEEEEQQQLRIVEKTKDTHARA